MNFFNQKTARVDQFDIVYMLTFYINNVMINNDNAIFDFEFKKLMH